MSNVRNIIGFDTPSKAKAQEELNSQSSKSNPLAGMGRGDSEKVKMETIQRLQTIGNVITSDEFQKYPPTQRQQLLLDFTYYSKVADSIL